MTTILGLIGLLAFFGSIALSYFSPFLLAMGWGRVITDYFKPAAIPIWILSTCGLLILSVVWLALRALLTNDSSVFGPIFSTAMLPGYSLYFSINPLWSLESIIGFILLALLPKQKGISRYLFALAALIFVISLLSASTFINSFYREGGLDQTHGLISFVMYLALFGNSFITPVFWFLSIARTNARVTLLFLILAVLFSVMAAVGMAFFRVSIDG